jgi:hypothetical protein
MGEERSKKGSITVNCFYKLFKQQAPKNSSAEILQFQTTASTLQQLTTAFTPQYPHNQHPHIASSPQHPHVSTLQIPHYSILITASTPKQYSTASTAQHRTRASKPRHSRHSINTTATIPQLRNQQHLHTESTPQYPHGSTYTAISILQIPHYSIHINALKHSFHNATPHKRIQATPFAPQHPLQLQPQQPNQQHQHNSIQTRTSIQQHPHQEHPQYCTHHSIHNAAFIQ